MVAAAERSFQAPGILRCGPPGPPLPAPHRPRGRPPREGDAPAGREGGRRERSPPASPCTPTAGEKVQPPPHTLCRTPPRCSSPTPRCGACPVFSPSAPPPIPVLIPIPVPSSLHHSQLPFLAPVAPDPLPRPPSRSPLVGAAPSYPGVRGMLQPLQLSPPPTWGHWEQKKRRNQSQGPLLQPWVARPSPGAEATARPLPVSWEKGTGPTPGASFGPSTSWEETLKLLSCWKTFPPPQKGSKRASNWPAGRGCGLANAGGICQGNIRAN